MLLAKERKDSGLTETLNQVPHTIMQIIPVIMARGAMMRVNFRISFCKMVDLMRPELAILAIWPISVWSPVSKTTPVPVPSTTLHV